MDLIKLYIAQLLKSACSRLRFPNSEKEKILSKIIANIENEDELFPKLKQIENINGLQDVSNKLIAIYKRLNKTTIEFDKISSQFNDDRDGLISSLRRYFQNSIDTNTFEIKKEKRRKIVFDDSTSTFYEISNVDEQELETSIKYDNFESETAQKIPDSYNIEISEQANEQFAELSEAIATNYNDFTAKNSSLNEAELINSEFQDEKIKEELESVTENYKDNLAEANNIESKVSEPNINIELKYDEEYIKNQFEEKFEKEEEAKSDEVYKVETVEKTEEILASSHKKVEKTKKHKYDDDSPSLFGQASFAETEEHKSSSHEELFLQFENKLMNNIKLLDEYLFKIISRISDPDIETQLINEANNLYHTAVNLDHLYVAKLIKTYWYALMAIREKKLAATKNEAELIRSTLIIIVAIIKNKDIDLHPYWANHNLLISRLNDLSYEV